MLAIAEELTEHGWSFATASSTPTTGCRGEEGTFTICSFWLVSALTRSARSAAPRTCASGSCPSRARCACTPRSSTAHRAPLGNFPQAFTHLALINAVMHVIRAEEEADSSGVFQPADAPM